MTTAQDLARMLLEEHVAHVCDLDHLTDCDLERAIDGAGAECTVSELQAKLLALRGKA